MNTSMELYDFSIQAASALPPSIATEALGMFPEQFSGNPHAGEAFQPRSSLGGRELYSKEQWETQKPVIKRLYNLENKPYSRVIEILRTEYNFSPTRRQFYRKISEWGFEKNIKDKEMRAVVQLLNDKKNQGKIFNVELKGQKIDPVKIQRWQKRYGKVTSVTRSIPSNSYGVASTQETFGAIVKEKPGQENDEDHSLTPYCCIVELSQSTDDFETRTFDIWSTVDVPGSPLLTRLFEALKIEWEDSIPCLDLNSSSPAAALISQAKAFSATEIREDVNPKVWVDFSLGAASEDLVNYSQEVFHGHDKLLTDPDSNQAMLSFSEWCFREWDFAKGQPLKMDISQLYGISPYPAPTGSGRYNSTFCRNRSQYATSLQLHDRENRIKLRLREMKNALGAKDPKTLLVMRDLGAIYSTQGKLRQAERIFRKIAVSSCKVYGLKHRATFIAYLGVVDVLLDQGEIFQALKIHQIIHDNVVALFERDDSLTLYSNQLRAIELCDDGFLEEAEKLTRQTLQIELHSYGLKRNCTKFDLGLLGHILRLRGRVVESERLMRINLQLCKELESYCWDDSIIIFESLSDLLRDQKRYDECRDLAVALVEYFGGSADQDTPEILSGLFSIAKCARSQRHLEDSEHELRIILERRIKCIGEQHPDTLRTMVELSAVLRDMGRYFEATNLLEKSYERRSKLCGLMNFGTIECCRCLARNYVDLGRWDDAVAILQRCIDDARELGKSSNLILLYTVTDLADIFWKRGLYREAVPLYEDCYEKLVRVHNISPTDRVPFNTVKILSRCYGRLELYEDAALILKRHFEDVMNFGEKRNFTLLENMIDMARFLQKAGQHVKAVTHYEECLNGFSGIQVSSEDSKCIYYGLYVCYEKLGRYDEMNDFRLRYEMICEAEKQARPQN